jgi:BON domain
MKTGTGTHIACMVAISGLAGAIAAGPAAADFGRHGSATINGSFEAVEHLWQQQCEHGEGGAYRTQDNAVSIPREPQSDVQLEMAVMEAIRSSILTNQTLIVAHVTKGEVTLEGSVLTPLAKREATRLAETVLGVTSIRNRLDVVGAETAASQ